MFIRDVKDCVENFAVDKSRLREIIKPGAFTKIKYSLAWAYLKPGESTLKHSLKSSEVYYVLHGEGVMYVDKDCEVIVAGKIIYVPPAAVQYLKNTGKTDLVFLCIVDPAWKVENDEVLE